LLGCVFFGLALVPVDAQVTLYSQNWPSGGDAPRIWTSEIIAATDNITYSQLLAFPFVVPDRNQWNVTVISLVVSSSVPGGLYYAFYNNSLSTNNIIAQGGPTTDHFGTTQTAYNFSIPVVTLYPGNYYLSFWGLESTGAAFVVSLLLNTSGTVQGYCGHKWGPCVSSPYLPTHDVWEKALLKSSTTQAADPVFSLLGELHVDSITSHSTTTGGTTTDSGSTTTGGTTTATTATTATATSATTATATTATTATTTTATTADTSSAAHHCSWFTELGIRW